jgi:hypothetical protein
LNPSGGAVQANGYEVYNKGDNSLAMTAGSITVTSGAWTAVSFGKTFAGIPCVALGTSHATAFPKVRKVTTTGCEVSLDGTATGTVYWTAIRLLVSAG